jgi:hypothetical protein
LDIIKQINVFQKSFFPLTKAAKKNKFALSRILGCKFQASNRWKTSNQWGLKDTLETQLTQFISHPALAG